MCVCVCVGEGGGEGRKPEEKEPSTGPTRGIIGPDYSSDQAQLNQNNRSTRWIKETKNGNLLEEAKKQILLGRWELRYKG